MKTLKYSIFVILFSIFALAASASAQSRTNRLTRPCPGSTTPATVSITVAGNIVATPCSGKTTTINGSANTLTSYLTSTVTYNNTAALANTALSVTVEAGGIYDVELTAHTTSGAAASLKLDFAGTATITNFIGQWGAYVTPGDETTAYNIARVTTAGTDFSGGTPLANGDGYITFRGSVEIANAGTFLLRGSQDLATAVNTTIIRGSVLKLTKLN